MEINEIEEKEEEDHKIDEPRMDFFSFLTRRFYIIAFNNV